ncbi:hypothetical protein OGCDGJMD_02082 [Cyanobium usitatum str. Tous]|jgi:hypothetical protein|uniref:hypothetical protein n=1 Tax=Cyanobium usitatum TaxID=2304190 RepID=UPI002AD3CF8F|nr:hypothetical protein [Cyanobium usitatum]CAK6696626.1 hypothetical protein OGCDGJMD_02082 [Cyanobium usitatum str. Tous]
MRDILLDGLPVLDLLEITASTSVVAALTNCDQSSVSRLHRRVSDQLGLDFRKTNGHYRAHANHAVLGSLRQASQLLRLGRGQLQLQWQGTPRDVQALQSIGDRALELVRERVLDLAVINGLDTLPPGWEDSRKPFAFFDLVAIGLVRYPIQPSCSGTNLDAVVLRREHLEQPAVQALISQIRAIYLREFAQLPELAWL